MTGSFGPNDTSRTLASRRMIGYLFLSSISMVRHLTGSVGCIATNNFGIGSISRKSYLCAFEHEPPQSLQLHNRKSRLFLLCYRSISNITGLSPTIIQEAAIEDAFDSATTRDSEEIASALGDGQSSIANNFEVHLDTLIDTNFLLVGTDSVMGDEHSGHADQVFDESSHQIEDSIHEFDMAFDLVEDNSMGLQMPLQVTEVVSTPTWCVEIDYRGDMHSRKSNVAEDECLETNTDIVFGGSLQRNEFTLQGQFANLKLVVTENSVFYETLSSNFDAPIRVDGEISLIPRDDEDEIAESYPSLFNQSFFSHFGALAIESMTDGLPTCYWFDTGQYVSQSITFVFRRRKCGDHLSATDFDKNDYLPIIGAQGGNVQFFAIMCSSCYSSGDDSKTAVKEQLTIGCSTCWRVTS
ncbi:hypothetical protein KY285_037747 [Solanum tuberosum]|nr:hypothetical protein KY285_037747 [Solanum tuberosum]